MATRKTTVAKQKRLAELCEDLRPAKKRMMDVLQTLENERLGCVIAKRLGSIIGRLEDFQRSIR